MAIMSYLKDGEARPAINKNVQELIKQDEKNS